jgi:hypothetical protein
MVRRDYLRRGENLKMKQVSEILLRVIDAPVPYILDTPKSSGYAPHTECAPIIVNF